MIRVLAASVLIVSAVAIDSPASAQSREEILESLQGSEVKTRGFKTPDTDNPEAAKSRAFIEGLSGKTRAIVVEERKKLIEIVEKEDLPTVDIEIFFEYNSDAIAPGAMKSVIALGQALGDERLKGAKFLIAGHTDARGSDGYNQDLSERRALSVKGFLVDNFHLDPGGLIVAGFGEEQPKIAHDPEADENRRVQVVNLGAVQQAGR